MSQHYNSDESLRKRIAKNIKLIVKDSSFTIEEIAKEVGLSEKQLTRYMAGTSEPTALVLYKMSNLFNIEVNSFFEFVFVL